MTTPDDIVTRLREEADRIRADAVDISTAFENCADEIERLREEIRKQTCCQDAADEIERLRNIIIGIALNKQVWKNFNYD